MAGAGALALALSWRNAMLEITLSVRITAEQVIKVLQTLAMIALFV